MKITTVNGGIFHKQSMQLRTTDWTDKSAWTSENLKKKKAFVTNKVSGMSVHLLGWLAFRYIYSIWQLMALISHHKCADQEAHAGCTFLLVCFLMHWLLHGSVIYFCSPWKCCRWWKKKIWSLKDALYDSFAPRNTGPCHFYNLWPYPSITVNLFHMIIYCC